MSYSDAMIPIYKLRNYLIKEKILDKNKFEGIYNKIKKILANINFLFK